MEYLRAFLLGGALCAVAQVLIDKTRLTPARILVLYVVAGVVLSGLSADEAVDAIMQTLIQRHII